VDRVLYSSVVYPHNYGALLPPPPPLRLLLPLLLLLPLPLCFVLRMAAACRLQAAWKCGQFQLPSWVAAPSGRRSAALSRPAG
jgi:hypothetical protein